MPRFRQKLVVVEALKFTTGNVNGLLRWINGGDTLAMDRKAICMAGAPNITIRTSEGDMRAEHGDWIIKGINGEFYPCKPSIFAATHEPSEHLVMVCGVDCHPGDTVCNNYCNKAPQKGPMAAAPPPGPDAMAELKS